jgi:hypothetical protein
MAITNYLKAWIDFKKTGEYKKCSEALKKKGIWQPYRDSILRTAFEAGWNATKTEIKFLN